MICHAILAAEMNINNNRSSFVQYWLYFTNLTHNFDRNVVLCCDPPNLKSCVLYTMSRLGMDLSI